MLKPFSYKIIFYISNGKRQFELESLYSFTRNLPYSLTSSQAEVIILACIPLNYLECTYPGHHVSYKYFFIVSLPNQGVSSSRAENHTIYSLMHVSFICPTNIYCIVYQALCYMLSVQRRTI